jgi:predicted XRE-type DNA-binding protein
MSSNVFADLELPNPDERLLKAKLVLAIREMVDGSALTQKQVAEQVGITQPAVSRMLNGMTKDISVEKLLNVILALGHNVHISIEKNEVNPESATVDVTHRNSDTRELVSTPTAA